MAYKQTQNGLRLWHQLIANAQPQGLDALLDDRVVFHSPILHRPQEGKQLTQFYLTAAFNVLCNESFQYVREVISDNDAMLEFTVDLDGIHVNGVDMIRFDDAGKIIDFKVMLRPLKAIQTVQQKMLEQLEAIQKQ